MNRRRFLGLSIAGSAIGLTGVSALAGPTSIASSLPSGIIYSKEKPGRWAKKVGGHAPLIKATKSKTGVDVTITTPHAMDGYKHYIVKHVVYDEKFNVIGEKQFDPMKDKSPVSTHSLTGVKGKIYVTSVCNKHDTWVASTTV